MAKIYFAEVRDIKDPLKSGRVKIRKYIHENDEKNIKERFWFHEKRRKYLFAWYHHHAHVKKEFS